MPYCPKCLSEYDPGLTSCGDCDCELVDALPEPSSSEPIAVFHAATAQEAEIVAATLRAEGVAAVVGADNPAIPLHSNAPDDTSPELTVSAPRFQYEQALAVLAEPPLTDAEIEAAEVADVTSSREADSAAAEDEAGASNPPVE